MKKTFAISLLLACLSVMATAQAPLPPKSVLSKARCVTRVINFLDSVLKYTPYENGRKGSVSIPIVLHDKFFKDSAAKNQSVNDMLALTHLYVLSDSGAYYALNLYFVDAEDQAKNFWVIFNPGADYYHRVAPTIYERYQLLTRYLLFARWQVKDLTSKYEWRRLGFLFSDEVDGMKMSDGQMDGYAQDVGEILYVYVLEGRQDIVPSLPISFNERGNDPNEYGGLVFFRVFCMKDITDAKHYPFRRS